MDNAQKAIMIGVGLFITIIIIAAVMLITGMGQDLMNSSTNELANMTSQLEKSKLQQYDGTTISGAQALAVVKQYHGAANLVVYVQNSNTSSAFASAVKTTGEISNPTGVETVESSSVTPLNQFTTKTGSCYIVPTANYKADLIKVGDAAVGIKFVKN